MIHSSGAIIGSAARADSPLCICAAVGVYVNNDVACDVYIYNITSACASRTHTHHRGQGASMSYFRQRFDCVYVSYL